MSGATIRKAEKGDLPAVLALYAELNGGRVLGLAEAEAIFARFATFPDYTLYVAELDGATVGTFTLNIMPNLAHWGTPSAVIESVVVSSAHRGGGLGRTLIGFALEKAREGGAYKAALSSNLASDKAHAFYDALGFERHGVSFRIDPAEARP